MARKRITPETLVDQLVAAGEWPPPALLRKVVEQGAEAVPAVVSRLRLELVEPTPIRSHLLGLLTLLPGGSAIPELIRMLESGCSEELLPRAIVAQGRDAVPPLMVLLRNDQLAGYDRGLAGQLALACAGDVATVCADLRELLESLVKRVKKLTVEERALAGSLVMDLAYLPDREAEPLLRKALKAGLGELTSVRELDALLAAPPAPPDEPLDWIEEYHEAYDERENA